jgi:hypothetical protein
MTSEPLGKGNYLPQCLNSSTPFAGIVEASEQRGHRTKKTLEIDPVQGTDLRIRSLMLVRGLSQLAPIRERAIRLFRKDWHCCRIGALL